MENKCTVTVTFFTYVAACCMVSPLSTDDAGGVYRVRLRLPNLRVLFPSL